jgi:hypothetical protein
MGRTASYAARLLIVARHTGRPLGGAEALPKLAPTGLAAGFVLGEKPAYLPIAPHLAVTLALAIYSHCAGAQQESNVGVGSARWPRHIRGNSPRRENSAPLRGAMGAPHG